MSHMHRCYVQSTSYLGNVFVHTPDTKTVMLRRWTCTFEVGLSTARRKSIPTESNYKFKNKFIYGNTRKAISQCCTFAWHARAGIFVRFVKNDTFGFIQVNLKRNNTSNWMLLCLTLNRELVMRRMLPLTILLCTFYTWIYSCIDCFNFKKKKFQIEVCMSTLVLVSNYSYFTTTNSMLVSSVCNRQFYSIYSYAGSCIE